MAEGYPRAPFAQPGHQPEYGPARASASTQPTIVQVLDSLYGQTELLGNAFVELLAAINPVLRPGAPPPPPPVNQGALKEPEPSRSELLDRMYGVQNRLEHLLREIREATTRAEVR